jgi:hypothetical protein
MPTLSRKKDAAKIKPQVLFLSRTWATCQEHRQIFGSTVVLHAAPNSMMQSS